MTTILLTCSSASLEEAAAAARTADPEQEDAVDGLREASKIIGLIVQWGVGLSEVALSWKNAIQVIQSHPVPTQTGRFLFDFESWVFLTSAIMEAVGLAVMLIGAVGSRSLISFTTHMGSPYAVVSNAILDQEDRKSRIFLGLTAIFAQTVSVILTSIILCFIFIGIYNDDDSWDWELTIAFIIYMLIIIAGPACIALLVALIAFLYRGEQMGDLIVFAGLFSAPWGIEITEAVFLLKISENRNVGSYILVGMDLSIAITVIVWLASKEFQQHLEEWANRIKAFLVRWRCCKAKETSEAVDGESEDVFHSARELEDVFHSARELELEGSDADFSVEL